MIVLKNVNFDTTISIILVPITPLKTLLNYLDLFVKKKPDD